MIDSNSRSQCAYLPSYMFIFSVGFWHLDVCHLEYGKICSCTQRALRFCEHWNWVGVYPSFCDIWKEAHERCIKTNWYRHTFHTSLYAHFYMEVQTKQLAETLAFFATVTLSPCEWFNTCGHIFTLSFFHSISQSNILSYMKINNSLFYFDISKNFSADVYIIELASISFICININ